jgi:hypothetical protein
MFAGVFALSCCAQDLAPRAYTIAPLRSNAIIVINSFFDGSIDYRHHPKQKHHAPTNRK